MPLLSALSRVKENPFVNTAGAEVVTSDGKSLPLLGAKLRGEARGGIARLVLEQTFENRYGQPLHVTYRMPLPADGAVSAYAFELAGRTITGRVDKKQEAREQFERAVAEGKTAALLEQNKGDIFTQEIGNLPPNGKLVAKITVDQRLAWLPEGEWELRFPTVIGPRFVNAEASEQDARDSVIAVDPDGISTRIQIAVEIRDVLVGGRKPSSPSHPIKKDRDGLLELDGMAALDRDIVIRWPVASREVGVALDVARASGGNADRSFGLLTIVPPAREATALRPAMRQVAMPRDLIVLLDTSGSMAGQPLETAKHVVAMLIESLGEQDRLEVIEFSNQPRRYKEEPVPGTASAKRDAIAWVRELSASSSTEMGGAVRQALRALRPGTQRQIVLVTDGYVAGEQQIVQLLHDKLPKSCRLHVLGIGSAVNRALATALARAGRGAEVLVNDGEDIERGCKRLVDRTTSPILTNVEISGSALIACAPRSCPDVFEGAPVVAACELSPEGGELVVRGEIAHAASQPGHPYRVATEAWIQKISVPPRRTGEGNQAIAALFARERVADLETAWTIGDQSAIDREIESIGVGFQISTRMTSWVAIDHDSKVDGPARHEAVPQNLPHGTKMESFGLRLGGVVHDGFLANNFINGYAPPPRAAAPMKTVFSYASSPSASARMKTQSMAPPSAEKTAGAPTLRLSVELQAAPHRMRKSHARLWLLLLLLLALAGALVWWFVL